MRKIVVTEFISIDGVFEDPGGSETFKYGGWTFKFDRGEEGDKFKYEELMQADTALLGRVTYQGFSEAWPSRTGEFADKLNSMAKYVVSTTLKEEDLTWNNSHLIKENIIEEISNLKKQPGSDIMVAGSGQLVNTLLEQNLVDQINLMVFPVVLGSGKKLFKEVDNEVNYRLVQVEQVGKDGILILVYKSDRGI